ncbi:MAG: protein translocase subunit SecD [Chitinispirillales bacterium]|nr:protein translocase subunit SecD [Chitinispirillales bacterium]
MKNMGLRFGIVAAVLALAVYLLIPSFEFYSKSEEEQEAIRRDNPAALKRVLNLGLDLQGGMRLVLEIDRSGLEANDRDVIDRAYAIIENRINQLGVAEPVLQKQGRDRIIVELPGIRDEQMAKDVIGRTAQLEFNLVRDDATRERALSIVESVVSGRLEQEAEGEEKTEDTESVENAESAENGSADADVDAVASVEDEDYVEMAADSRLFGGEGEARDIDIEEPGTFRSMIEYLGEMAVVRTDNVRRVAEYLGRDDVRRALDRAGLGGNSFLWGNEIFTPSGSNITYRFLYYLKSAPEMRGDGIKNAMSTIDQSGMHAGRAKVDFELNAAGARRFATVTGYNINRQLAIVLDSTVYSAPRIQSRISGGRAEITGSFTVEEARALAIILRAGALPAPVQIVEERTIGPSLGQDAIQKGIMAGVIGVVLVVLFMLIYYKASGVIALFALLLNMLMVLATMSAISATLTLPGIAGLILLVGMGIDANVLILERIREELQSGRTVRSAIEQGYENALSAILDANITSIMTGFILMWKGTGPIRGFAVTLIIGILASLFTALFVTRLLMMAMFQKRQKLSI